MRTRGSGGVEPSISAGSWRPPELARETFGDYGARWLAQRLDVRPRTQELYALLWRRWLEPNPGVDAGVSAAQPRVI